MFVGADTAFYRQATRERPYGTARETIARAFNDSRGSHADGSSVGDQLAEMLAMLLGLARRIGIPARGLDS